MVNSKQQYQPVDHFALYFILKIHPLTALKDIKVATLTFKQLQKRATVHFLESAPQSVNVSNTKVNVCLDALILHQDAWDTPCFIQKLTLPVTHPSSGVLNMAKNIFQLLELYLHICL